MPVRLLACSGRTRCIGRRHNYMLPGMCALARAEPRSGFWKLDAPRSKATRERPCDKCSAAQRAYQPTTLPCPRAPCSSRGICLPPRHVVIWLPSSKRIGPRSLRSVRLRPRKLRLEVSNNGAGGRGNARARPKDGFDPGFV
eukprot:scaffold15517_cov114-Isochrysis_galbana.AAC.6